MEQSASLGKRLKVTIAFNYGQDNDGIHMSTTGRRQKEPCVGDQEKCSLSVRSRSMRKKRELDGPQVGILYMG
jgi:hypothetical protein